MALTEKIASYIMRQNARYGVFCMKKITALLLALGLILAILIFNAPDINYGQGPEDIHESAYYDIYDDAYRRPT